MPMRYAVRRWPPPPTVKPKLVQPARLDDGWNGLTAWNPTATWGPDVLFITIYSWQPSRGLIMRGRR